MTNDSFNLALTRLLYLESLEATQGDATVLDISSDPATNTTVIILDQTVFYPQGGGQPYDQGIITQQVI